MTSRRFLVAALVTLAAAALVAGPAAARPLGMAEAREVARAAVGDQTAAVNCFRARARTRPPAPSPRRILCLVGHEAVEGSICRSLVDVRTGRGAAAAARAKLVRLEVCVPLHSFEP